MNENGLPNSLNILPMIHILMKAKQSHKSPTFFALRILFEVLTQTVVPHTTISVRETIDS